MRATRAENPGHQRGRVGKFPMVFISLGSPIEKVASFRNASCICKKLLCSNKTNVTHRHARSTRNGAGARKNSRSHEGTESELRSGNPYRLGISPPFVGVIEDWEFP